MIELVAAADRTIGADQRRAGQRQIADRVDRLVADEFVGKRMPSRIEHAIFGDHDGILERGAERIARAPQLGDVAHEAESPRPRQIRGGTHPASTSMATVWRPISG